MVRRGDTAFLRDLVRLCTHHPAHSLVLRVEQSQEHPFAQFAYWFALSSIGLQGLNTTPLSSLSATIQSANRRANRPSSMTVRLDSDSTDGGYEAQTSNEDRSVRS